MLKKSVDGYKRKLVVLEKGHSEVATTWTTKLAKARTDMGDSAKTLADKDAALKDLCLKYALLSRTLYGVSLSSAMKEATIWRSMAPVEDEVYGEKALQTRADMINYIRVLEDDYAATSQDTYDSTVAYLKLKNQWVELVSEGTGPLHHIEGGQVVFPDLGDGSGAGELADQEVHMDEAT